MGNGYGYWYVYNYSYSVSVVNMCTGMGMDIVWYSVVQYGTCGELCYATTVLYSIVLVINNKYLTQ